MKLTKLLCLLPVALNLNLAFAQSKPSLIKQTLEGSTMRDGGSGVGGGSRREGGSGVGGGVVYESIIAWCDETGNILKEATQEAREEFGLRGNSIGALRIYFDGLKQASGYSQSEERVTIANSLTLKYVSRGIRLANILGLTDIINGRVDSSLEGQKKIDSIVAFFDWYVGYAQKIGTDLDKYLYIPYIVKKDCRGPGCDSAPQVSMIELEKKMFSTVVSFIKQLEPTFVRLKSDGTNYYTNISTETYFKILSFVTAESAKDLRDSIYASAYSCQANRLDRTATKIESYLSNRGAGELDAYQLNKFTLELREIVKALDNKKCF